MQELETILARTSTWWEISSNLMVTKQSQFQLITITHLKTITRITTRDHLKPSTMMKFKNKKRNSTLMTNSITAMARSIQSMMMNNMARSHLRTTSQKSTEVEEASYQCKLMVTARARESNMHQSLRSVNLEMRLACNRYLWELTQNLSVKSSRWLPSTSMRKNPILKRSKSNPFPTKFIQIKSSILWTPTKTRSIMIIIATFQIKMSMLTFLHHVWLKEDNLSLVNRYPNTRKTVYQSNMPSSRLNFSKEGLPTTGTVDKTQSPREWKPRKSLRSLQPVGMMPTIHVIIGRSLRINGPDSRSSLSKNNLLTNTTLITVSDNRISTKTRLNNK